MKPVTQTRTGSSGNCFAASIASILEVPLQETDGLHEDTVNRYLARHGLRYEQVPYDPESPPVGYTTIEGVSPRGGQHACVAYNGRLAWDPHPVEDDPRRGLVKPERYGLLLPLRGAKDGMRKARPDEGARSGYPYHYVYKGFGLQKIDKADTDNGKGWVNIFGPDGEVIDAVSSFADARWLIDQWTRAKALDSSLAPVLMRHEALKASPRSYPVSAGEVQAFVNEVSSLLSASRISGKAVWKDRMSKATSALVLARQAASRQDYATATKAQEYAFTSSHHVLQGLQALEQRRGRGGDEAAARAKANDAKMSSLLALLAAYLIGRYYASREERRRKGSGSL